MGAPVLRFKDEWGQEFPKWDAVTLGKIVTIRSGISPSSYDLSESGVYPFLKVEDLNNCSKYQVQSREYSSSTKNLVPKNSVIFPKRGAAILNNKVRVSISPVLMDSNLMALTSNNDNLSFEYLYYKLFNDQLFKIADTSSIPQINNKHILPYLVSLPSIAEQTKIANFLTAVDEKIQHLTQKADLLAQYKKGVMQQIFSQELRFKDDDGAEFPEWENKILGQFSHIRTGKSNREDSSLIGEYTFFDRSQDIRTSDIFLFDCEAIIVAGEGQEFIPKYFAGKFDLHQRTYAIMDFGEISGKFIYFYVYQFRSYFLSQAVGSTVKSLRLPMFQKMPFHLPCHKEQTKIANFLSAIDDKITHTQTQLAAVKQYKQGLLQQMFV